MSHFSPYTRLSRYKLHQQEEQVNINFHIQSTFNSLLSIGVDKGKKEPAHTLFNHLETHHATPALDFLAVLGNFIARIMAHVIHETSL